MRIKRLKVENFRNLEKLDINFLMELILFMETMHKVRLILLKLYMFFHLVKVLEQIGI